MKKKYSSKLAWMGATLCAFLLVACGLKVADVTLSADEIEQGGEVTLTSSFDRVDGYWSDANGIYLLYAVRVPSDWDSVDMLEAYTERLFIEENDSTIKTDQTFNIVDCPAYAALAEFCYPKDGYKWIGFQTESAEDLHLDNNGVDKLVTSVKLKAGDETGEFHLDFIAGSLNQNIGTPADMLNNDGTINLNVAFGKKSDGNVADVKHLPSGEDYMGFSEYIVNVCTLTTSERNERAQSRMEYKVNGVSVSPYEVGGDELSDDAISKLKLNVKVNEKAVEPEPEPEPEVLPEISELISIDGGMIDGNFITCESDLAITFDIPEGYDIWYRLSTDGASVRRKAHGEEGEHDGYEKYEADQAIQLTGEHKLLECFVCNPETGNHSEVATYTLDIATGVFEIGMEWTNNAPVYNLKGQRVYDTTAPGIYIKNGKKFIVK